MRARVRVFVRACMCACVPACVRVCVFNSECLCRHSASVEMAYLVC